MSSDNTRALSVAKFISIYRGISMPQIHVPYHPAPIEFFSDPLVAQPFGQVPKHLLSPHLRRCPS